MPIKPRSFDIGGESFTLSTGDFKKVEQLISELKKAKTLYDGQLATKKKLFEIETRIQALRNVRGRRMDHESKVDKERVVIFKKLELSLHNQMVDSFNIMRAAAVPFGGTKYTEKMSADLKRIKKEFASLPIEVPFEIESAEKKLTGLQRSYSKIYKTIEDTARPFGIPAEIDEPDYGKVKTLREKISNMLHLKAPVEVSLPKIEPVRVPVEVDLPKVEPVKVPVEVSLPKIEPVKVPVEVALPKIDPIRVPVDITLPKIEPVRVPVEVALPKIEPVKVKVDVESPVVEPIKVPVEDVPDINVDVKPRTKGFGDRLTELLRGFVKPLLVPIDVKLPRPEPVKVPIVIDDEQVKGLRSDLTALKPTVTPVVNTKDLERELSYALKKAQKTAFESVRAAALPFGEPFGEYERPEPKKGKKEIEEPKERRRAPLIDIIKTDMPKIPPPIEVDDMIAALKPKSDKDKTPAGGGEKQKIGIKEGVLAGIGLMLVKALQKGLAQSKIVSTVGGHIGRLLGLLVDIVLLPFLPLIVWGILMLLKGIMTFKPIWDALVAFLGTPLSIALLAGTALAAFMAASIIYKVVDIALTAAAQAIYAWLTTGGAAATFTATINFLMGTLSTLGAWLLEGLMAGSILAWTITIVIGLILGLAIAKLLEVSGILEDIFDWGEQIRANNKDWLAGLGSHLQWLIPTAKIFLGILEAIANLMNKFAGFSFLTQDKMSEIIKQGSYQKTVMERLRTKYGQGVSFSAAEGYTFEGKRLEEFQTGGVVSGTGAKLAVVHGGETIIPAGKESTTTNTFNFYGYQDDKFVQKVKEVVRLQGANHSL